MIVLRRLRVENFKLLRSMEVTFPRHGSVLVEGLNESGKSTLFECVFFGIYGVPLAAEGRGKGNLDSVIRYGTEAATVELLLEADGAELEISRSLRRGKASQATLVVLRPDAPEVRVAGVQAVNARVVEELGGLDGEALLNSCFVEQKKLSKLEDLAPGQRRDSLRKLLNLERLTSVAERLRVTVQDERVLVEARDRLELAEVTAWLPVLVSERAQLEAELTGGANPVGTAVPESTAPRAEEVDGFQWRTEAARLRAVRRRRASTQRAAILLASAGVVGLGLVAGLLAAGAADAAWGLPVVAALALAAILVLRSARPLGAEGASLESALALRRDAVMAKLGELDGRRSSAEARLGVSGAGLELEECRREVARLGRRREVKRCAAGLVEGTMERIVRMVLPNTERNLGQILPLLTAGRYHEARIAEDYQVQVWDDSAGRYVSKSLFSGGARDQFSLALRLAFALATLPQELGTAPGFIFLDEPLSSFDGPRTEALVRLLTAGQVADSFAQIFVISHNRSFDLRAFQYRLVLREGRVVDSNLPAG